MKVISSTTFKSLQTKTLTKNGKKYTMSYNKEELIEKDDGSKFYNLTLFYKKKKGVRLIKHYYTDLVTSFLVQLVVIKGDKHKVITGSDKISLFFKQFI